MYATIVIVQERIFKEDHKLFCSLTGAYSGVLLPTGNVGEQQSVSLG